jgi:hypothetical protein
MSTVEEIVEAIKELPREKQAELWHSLSVHWSTQKPELVSGIEGKSDDQLQLYHWLTLNLITPRKRSRPRRPPISIKGKPISETVIEDRR